MYRFLFSRRWLGVWAALLVLVPAFIALGRWQLDRFDQRVTANRLIQTNLAAAPVPVERLAPPGAVVPRAEVWRRATAIGRYDEDRQRLVRNRTSNGRTGFHVLVPLVTESGTAVLVDRGWIPAGETARDTPVPPPAPPGTVTVIGRLRASQHGSTGGPDMPAGQIAKIDIGRLSGELDLPLDGGYLELVEEKPAASPAPVPPGVPELSTGPHLAYAVQWFLFAIGAVIGVGYLARREALDLRAAAVDGAEPAEPDDARSGEPERLTSPPRPPSPP
ncbi:MAG TPA: SURF1 family protein [Actinomycetes bacterium]|nr:SURF1 family protein [Actinomycetes bacterium]